MVAFPTGTVTFLFTDVAGSTRLWERHPDATRQALVQHDAIVEFLTEQHGGQVIRPRGEGDSRFCVFVRATDAVAAASAIQRALHAEAWPTPTPIRVRMALHTGEADLRDGDYYGSAVNRCARLRAIAHGGQALLSGVTAELVADALPAGVGVRDLGEQRLRDLTRAERVYQLTGAGLPDDFPPPASLDRLLHRLPVQATPLVGRGREVAAVCAQLRRPEVRLLTLTGPGGTGKTRLALQAAAELIDDFPDGVAFVPLAAVSDPELVPATVAQVLGVREVQGRSSLDGLKEHLAGKRLLLVLDNFEQVLAAAPIAAELRAGGPELALLVTSRAALRVYGEHELAVPPLTLPDPAGPASVDRIGQHEAVRLFVECARAARADFALTEGNAGAVAAICRRLDGLPLAIELAAAWTKVLPPAALLERLEHRLALLTGGARDLPARHRALRSAIGWSHDLLAPDEQALFRRLAVFVGGCTIEAAEAVCADAATRRAGDAEPAPFSASPDPPPPASGGVAREEVLGLLGGLAALVDASLLRQEQSGDEPGFGMLETVREYALERLVASGEADAVRRRHAAHYLALAEAAEPELEGADTAPALARLEAERANLRAALGWWTDQGEAGPALRLASALWLFWYFDGPLTEGRAWLAAVLALPGAAAPATLRARALAAAGIAAAVQADYQAGERLLGESLALARAVGDRRGVARALYALGLGNADRGAPAAARPLLEEAVALARREADAWCEGRALVMLGQVAATTGDIAAARAAFAERLALARRAGDGPGVGQGLEGLALAAFEEGDWSAAEGLYAQALAVLRGQRHRFGEAMCLLGLGWVALERGDEPRARAVLAESVALAREIGHRRALAFALEGLAAATAGRHGQDAERALRLAGAAAALRGAVGLSSAPPWAARLERWLARAREALGAARSADAQAEGQAMTVEQAIAYALS